jgi:hypothetical protein
LMIADLSRDWLRVSISNRKSPISNSRFRPGHDSSLQ